MTKRPLPEEGASGLFRPIDVNADTIVGMEALAVAVLSLALIGLLSAGVRATLAGHHRCRGCGERMTARRVIPDPRRTRRVWTCSDACQERDYEGSVW